VIATARKTRQRVVRDLADALQELATSAPLRQRLSMGALQRAQDFAWDRLVGGVYAEIADVLSVDHALDLQPQGA
jgi:glycosyltransferase involved in cell wall biosynthesis